MSVVYPSDVEQDPQQQSFWVEHPFITLAIAAGIAIVIYEIIKGKSASSSPPTSGQAAAATSSVTTSSGVAATDPAGNPIYYVPTSDTFLNYNYTANSNNPVTNSNNPITTTTTSTSNSTENEPAPPNQGSAPPPAPSPQPKPPVVTPPPTQTKGSWTCRYTVVSGDTLSGIASRYGTTWPAIYGHNTTEVNLIAGLMHDIIPGGPWNNIRPGEVLFVPCK